MKQLEYWDACDEEGRLLGSTLVRGEPIPEGVCHVVSCVVVRHTDGEFLLLLRAPEKLDYPNWWEVGAGGSVLRGESPQAAARRELREETGIDRGIWTETGTTREGHSLYRGFLCVTDWPKEQIRLQPGETADFRWLSPGEFTAFLRSPDCIPRLRTRLEPLLDRLTGEQLPERQ